MKPYRWPGAETEKEQRGGCEERMRAVCYKSCGLTASSQEEEGYGMDSRKGIGFVCESG